MTTIQFNGFTKLEPTVNNKGIPCGVHNVLFPSDESALSAILKHAARHNIVTDVNNNPQSVTSSADLHVSARFLSFVQFSGTTVRVGGATKVRDIITELSKKQVFLPLHGRCSDDLTTVLRSPSKSFFSSSVGSIRSFIKKIDLITSCGEKVVLSKDSAKVDEALTPHCSDLLLSVTFDTWSEEQSSHVWASRLSFAYNKGSFEKLIQNAFQSDRFFPDGVNVTVQTHPMEKSFSLVSVTLSGMKPMAEPELDIPKMVSILFPNVSEGEARTLFPVYFGSRTLEELIRRSDAGTNSFNRMSSFYSMNVPNDGKSAFLGQVTELVDSAIGVTAGNVSKFPNINVSVQLTQGSSKQLSTSAVLSSTRASSREERSFVQDWSRLFQVEKEGDQLSTIAHKDVSKNVSSLFRASSTLCKAVSGFRGTIFTPQDHGYSEAIEQYASSSFPQERTSPAMVAYPASLEDVKAIVNHAKTSGFFVVPRTGGHSLGCLSSGGANTIVLDMSQFLYPTLSNLLSREHVTAGVGNLLDTISFALLQEGLFIPHGSCYTIGLGGHVQTCGYGIASRPFGLLSDHIRSFHIVLANEEVTDIEIYRPDVTVNAPKHELNDEIYSAVLGGGAGSFGILTNVTMDVLRDEEHPHSSGSSGTIAYTKEKYAQVLDLARRWSNDSKAGNLKEDISLICTINSIDFGNVLQSSPQRESGSKNEYLRGLISLEMIYGNADGSDQDDGAFQLVSDEFNNIFCRGSESKFIEYEGATNMSEVMNTFLQRVGGIENGREFVHPYKKRKLVSSDELTEAFMSDWLNLIDEVMKHENLFLSSKISIGKGEYQPNRAFTSAQQTDYSFGFSFDLFYTDEGKLDAIKYQNKMKDLCDKHLVSDGNDRRVHWGPFDETRIEEVWSKYYDSAEVFENLRSIKGQVDPTDLFHTEFTVPPL